MNALKSFAAGFLSTLIFHQGVFALFYLMGAVPRAPYAMDPVPPLGIPSVLSLAFWGGVWGLVVWRLIADSSKGLYWIKAILIGAIGPSAVALLLVFPLKGMPIAGGGDPKIIIGALVLNGAWGFGVALLMRWFKPRKDVWY